MKKMVLAAALTGALAIPASAAATPPAQTGNGDCNVGAQQSEFSHQANAGDYAFAGVYNNGDNQKLITQFGGGQLVKTFREAVQENDGGHIC